MKAVEEPMMAVIHIQNTAPRAAGGNCSHDTHQVAHAHSCSGRDDESLEGGKTVFAVLFLVRAFNISGKSRMGRKWVGW